MTRRLISFLETVCGVLAEARRMQVESLRRNASLRRGGE